MSMKCKGAATFQSPFLQNSVSGPALKTPLLFLQGLRTTPGSAARSGCATVLRAEAAGGANLFAVVGGHDFNRAAHLVEARAGAFADAIGERVGRNLLHLSGEHADGRGLFS